MWNFKGTLWNSTQNILPIHWKIWFLYDIEILRALRFKSSNAFLKRPPVVVEPNFKGIQPVKRIKRVVHFIITLFWRYLTINRHQVNSIWRYLSMTSHFCYCLHEVLDPSKKTPKIYFSTNNTFHLIIMMISVVLCKINEEINYVSIFHKHVVRILLRNRPVKLLWNRNKKS